MATVRVREVSYHSVRLRTRMPFRYGIAELRETPHLFVRADVEVGGKVIVGVSADNLPPKWFTKDPASPFERDLADMMTVIRAAGRHAVEVGGAGSAFELYRATYERQKGWAAGTGHPPLLWNFGVSLIERAVIDAVCRGVGVPFHRAVREGVLGVRDARQLRAELPATRLAELLPAAPLGTIAVRHTVGLSDPLTAGDIAEGERLADGLPQSLEDSIRAYGLRYFKIKLSGDVTRDAERLRRLASLLERESPAYAYTLDGNENFSTLPPFRALWDSLAGDPLLRGFLSRLIFVEQPLHRDVALSDEVGRELTAWGNRPRMIIDESDADYVSLPRALAAGYVGTSHKNCKGVFKGLANFALLKLRTEEGDSVLSGEDLTNTGPVSLLQDLTVLATLGIGHAERNGQHYLRGMDQFPTAVQEAVLEKHGDLYRRHERGFAVVRVEDGMLSTGSVSRAPFGYGMAFDPGQFPTVPE